MTGEKKKKVTGLGEKKKEVETRLVILIEH
jgi:hypothetical protein